MEDRIYDYWVATLQDGYIGKLVPITEAAGGAAALFNMPKDTMRKVPGISERLAGYITEQKKDIGLIEEEYHRLAAKGITYVNHADDDFPEKLKNIPGMPYGLFVKGSLPGPGTCVAAVIGARQCSEYGKMMAQYFGSRLAKEGLAIVSGMAYGIDGLAMQAAIDAGGTVYGVLGCGVDVVYPAKHRGLYNSLCGGGNGVMSEYAPGSPAIPRKFPPRNRLISGLCDVLIVVEARAKSGTLITADMAIDQGRSVMVVPGRLTDSLSVGCLSLMYQGAFPATSVDAVLQHLGIERRDNTSDKPIGSIVAETASVPAELKAVADLLTLEPQSAENIASKAGLALETTLIMLTKLEMKDIAKELWPGFFVMNATVS